MGEVQPPVVHWTDLGLLDYETAWALQREIVAERKEGRGVDRLLTVEHPPVLTLGRRGNRDHVLADEGTLSARGIPVFEVERGGDVTYHGPGQMVAYPILDLRLHRKDVRWFSTQLLEALIRTLAHFEIPAYCREGVETGVWVDASVGPAKIAALGVRVERWVSYHGVALNVEPDLTDFDLIVPCGLADVRTTSISHILGRELPMTDVTDRFVREFSETFGVTVVAADLDGAA